MESKFPSSSKDPPHLKPTGDMGLPVPAAMKDPVLYL